MDVIFIMKESACVFIQAGKTESKRGQESKHCEVVRCRLISSSSKRTRMLKCGSLFILETQSPPFPIPPSLNTL